ncbi:beta-hexosaminidase, partial [Vibrio parahaemolyticus VPTS-2010]
QPCHWRMRYSKNSRFL